MAFRTRRRAGLIRVDGTGFFSMVDVDRHFDELGALCAAERLAGRPVRVVVDLRTGSPQSQEVADRIRVRTKATYLDEDRVAIIVASPILRMQLKRIHAGQNFGIFLTALEADAFVARAPGVDEVGRRTG